MYSHAAEQLDRLRSRHPDACLTGGLTGLEVESLRVGPDGAIAQTPHPASLGSALKHPWITTDYSEALMEFITPPLDDPLAALDYAYQDMAIDGFDKAHKFALNLLW